MKYLCLFLMLSLFGSGLQAQSWTITEKSPMPEAVSNNAVCEGFVNGVPYVYSFGGIDTTKIYTGIHLRSYRYNTQTDVWEGIPPLPDTLGKIAAAASRIGDIIYIIGGYHVFANSEEASSNRVHRYDVVNNRYLEDGQPIPTPIDDQVQLVWKDSLIFVITGWSNTRNVPLVQIYNPATDQWQSGTSTPNSSRYRSFGASGSLLGDTIYYFGGASDIGSFSAQDEVRKGVINPDDPTQIDWSRFDSSPEKTAYRASSTTIDSSVYWIGGSAISYNYNGLAYTNNNGVPPSRQILSLTPPSETFQEENYDLLPMDLRGLAVTGERERYLAGGMQDGQEVSNRCFQLEWQGISTSVQTPKPDVALQLWPNPATDYIWLESSKAASFPLNLQVRDENGRLIREKEGWQAGDRLYIGDLAEGRFLIMTEDAQGRRQHFFLIHLHRP
ncbi:MAG: hypothetical protein AAFV25_09055 [Bacteroidota bacterium]